MRVRRSCASATAGGTCDAAWSRGARERNAARGFAVRRSTHTRLAVVLFLARLRSLVLVLRCELESGLLAALLGPIGAVAFGGIGAIAVAGIWAYLFPEIRRARTFDLPETALPEAVMQEKPA